MLDAFDFVQGSVSKKELQPALTYLQIKDGFVRSSNGTITACSPIKLTLEARPHATSLFTALKACSGTVALSLTPEGKLMVKAGSFRAFVNCTEETPIDVTPQGVRIPLPKDFLPILKKLAPFMAKDSNRPWAQGILFRNNSAFATNNVVLVEHWLGYSFPIPVNLPHVAIDELLRINEEPESIQLSENTCTFFFKEGKWLHTPTFSPKWPDFQRFFEEPTEEVTLNKSLWKAVKKIAAFVDDHGSLFLADKRIFTHNEDNSGASFDVSDLRLTGTVKVNINHFSLLENVAESICFSMYPRPLSFFGDKLRGCLVGLIL